MATCPVDDEPLVMTFEVKFKEFICMVCGTYYEFLSPKPATETPELNARYAELKALFDSGVRP